MNNKNQLFYYESFEKETAIHISMIASYQSKGKRINRLLVPSRIYCSSSSPPHTHRSLTFSGNEISNSYRFDLISNIFLFIFSTSYSLVSDSLLMCGWVSCVQMANIDIINIYLLHCHFYIYYLFIGLLTFLHICPYCSLIPYSPLRNVNTASPLDDSFNPLTQFIRELTTKVHK